MALYPQVRRAVEASASEEPVYAPGYDIAASRVAARREALAGPRQDVAEVTEVDADGVRCRLYRPAGALPGVIVHLHGGGFVFHDIDVYDAPARRLAHESRVAVLSVDYRLAPEHRFPAAVDDVDVVIEWLTRHAVVEGLAGPAYLHGDSAGANLALVGALRHPRRFQALGLIYPFLDPTRSFPSYADPANAGFEPAEGEWYWRQYAADPADFANPDLAPLLSDSFGLLPPTIVITAEHDPLRDEGEELARRIAEAGVSVVASRQLGQVHGFWRQLDVFDAAGSVLCEVAAFFRRHRP
jgi:acetyl esterase